MYHSLKQRAEQVLRDNDRQRYTVPSRRLYPHQWAWDSGFAAIGWAHIDLERACLEVDTLLAGQWEDGRIPHIQFHIPSPDYFPGPESWGNQKSSTISNPPIWTLAAERLLTLGASSEKVTSWLPLLERSHCFLVENRDPLSWNCLATCHPWENGQDNLPAWDQALEAIDPSLAPKFRRVDTKKVKDASQRPTDLQYQRYMALVKEFSDNGFQMGGFAVYDPFLTTLLILAEEALERMAKTLGFQSQAGARSEKLRKGLVENLWCPELGRYRYFDARASRPSHCYTSGSLAPVLLGEGIPGHQGMLAALQSDFQTSYGLATVAPTAPEFDPVCYWRGPSWINLNWLFSSALGAEFVESTLQLVENIGFWEYFHPMTGEGLGTDQFTWTAALVLDLIAVQKGS